ncbi:MAG: glycosyltransferase family 2 protein [Desulfurococcaceae archaeon]
MDEALQLIEARVMSGRKRYIPSLLLILIVATVNHTLLRNWVINITDDVDLSQVTVVIPVLNESESIGIVLREILEVGVPLDNIIVVDGHSKDGTDEISRKIGVKVVYQDRTGKADAVKKGLSIARSKYVVVMDGDYTYPAKYIPQLLKEAIRNNCSEVIGARVHGRENIPFVNRIGNRLITAVFNILYGTRLRDVLSGMYLVNLDQLRDILYETEKFSIEVEIASHIAGNSLEICEIPIEYRRRIGKKKLKVLDGFRITMDLIKMTWKYNPVFFMFMAASLLVIPGVALGLYVAYHYFFAGVNYFVKGIAALVLTSAGFNAMLLGILALYLKRMELRLRKLMLQRTG